MHQNTDIKTQNVIKSENSETVKKLKAQSQSSL